MSKNRTILLIISLILVLLIVMAVQFIAEKETPPPTPTPTPTPLPKTTPITDFSKIPFEVRGTTLKEGEPIGIADPITIFFSKPVDQNSFFYQIIPLVEIDYYFDRSGNILTTLPKRKNIWGYDTNYKFIIQGKTKSFDGNDLGEDVIINFQTTGFGGE